MGIACERNTWAADHSANSSPSSTNSNVSKGKRRRPLGERSGSASSGAQSSCRSLRRRRRSSPEHICSLAVAINTKASGGNNVEPKLPKDVKDRLGELRILSERAEDSDKSARKELRKALR